MQQNFFEFIDRKQRESKKHLNLIEKLLQKGGLSISSHLENENPYIFVKSPSNKLSFDGIRVYEIGGMIAYRVQREQNTQPYGKAYILDLEDMFNDFMSENMKEEEAGNKVIESVALELKKFFDRSEEAEQELLDSDDKNIIVKSAGTDFSGVK